MNDLAMMKPFPLIFHSSGTRGGKRALSFHHQSIICQNSIYKKGKSFELWRQNHKTNSQPIISSLESYIPINVTVNAIKITLLEIYNLLLDKVAFKVENLVQGSRRMKVNLNPKFLID